MCRATNLTTLSDQAICTEAENMCRDNVEGPYYYYSGRGVYDIRHPADDPTPPSYYVDYLNLDSTRNALGVNLNYSQSNDEVYYAFQQTGDFVYPNFIEDLEMLLNNSVRVSLIYGDADYICNWYGFSNLYFMYVIMLMRGQVWRPSCFPQCQLHPQSRIRSCWICTIHGGWNGVWRSSTAWKLFFHSCLRGKLYFSLGFFGLLY